MKPARYIFLNRGLKMSGGKCAAQAAHAETLAMQDYAYHTHEGDKLDPVDRDWLRRQDELFDVWFGHGHYAKYVMKADNAVMMYSIERYLGERGFKTYMVIDEGHTENTYFVPTALGVELVDKDDERVGSIFGEFRLYRDEERKPEPPKKRLWSRR